MFTACVITVSDRCAAGSREDKSGPAIRKMLSDHGYDCVYTAIVPDEKSDIIRALNQAVDREISLILTSGGTGFSPRDVTPEATEEVYEKHVPGIPEAMRLASLKITPRAILSRETAGIKDRSLIINLPGSPKAATENLEAVIDPVRHGLNILLNLESDCGAHHHA